MVEAAALDPLSIQMVDVRSALRDAWHGGSTPPNWMRTEDQMEDIEAAEAEKQKVQELLGQVSAGAQVAEQIGAAGQALAPEPPVQEGA